MSSNPIRTNSLILGIFAVVTAALLATTNLGTKDRIAAAERLVAQRALLEIVPAEIHNNDLLTDTLPIPVKFQSTLGVSDAQVVNVARQNNRPIAFIVPSVAPDGYNGNIAMMVGINIDGTLAGVRAVSHRETPGLGDKVDTNKNDWILGFKGKSLNNPKPDAWAVKKDGGDFDQFTGATITPRAVVKQVKATLRYFQEDRERLLKAADVSQPQPDNEVHNDG